MAWVRGDRRMSSTDPEYTSRLQRLSGRRWKQFVPNRYRWNIRRLAIGRVLDVGCGIGPCLDFVRPRGVGVDPNETAVAVPRLVGRWFVDNETVTTARMPCR